MVVVVVVVVAVILHNILFLSNGPNLSKYFAELAKGDWAGKVSGKLEEQSFASTRKNLVANIITALEKRTADVSGDFISATEIANFKYWPLHGQPEVTGEIKL